MKIFPKIALSEKIILFFSFLIIANGCLYHTSIKTDLISKPAVRRLLSHRKKNIYSLKGIARVSIFNKSEGINEKFKSSFCLTHTGFGSIEGFGPFATIFYKLLFNPKELYLYLPQDNILYKGKNTSVNFYKLLHFNFKSTYLIDYLSANVPFDPSVAKINSISFSKDYLIKGEAGDKKWFVRISSNNMSDILEFILIDDKGSITLDIKYDDFREIKGYRMPTKISFFQKKDGLFLEIKFLSIKINEDIDKEKFSPSSFLLIDNLEIKKLPIE